MPADEPSTSQLSMKGLDRLHDAMAAHVAAGRVPGLVTLVACGDDVHVDTIGTPAFADGAPLARNAIFRIASLTKPITVVSCRPSTPSSTTPSPPTDRSRSKTSSATGSASAP